MVLIREDIPTKVLSAEVKPVKAMFIELNSLKKKWLLFCDCNPYGNNILQFLEVSMRNLDLYVMLYAI